MAYGPGKYDDTCTLAREHAEAQACIVIIRNGKHGSGFSLQVAGTPGDLHMINATLPAVLRELAEQIEKENGRRDGVS